jgi:hypothetical protein
MEWGSVSDWVTAAANVGLALAAIAAARQGIRALSAWRDEAVGKRRLEIAEQTLADFYEARDIINGARFPMTFAGEGSTRPAKDNEPDGRKVRLDGYYVVYERLKRHEEFFAGLLARRYRFIALFGADAGKSFNDLLVARNDILVTVNRLVGEYADQWTAVDRRRMEEKIGWGDSDADPVRKDLDRIVQTVEGICRPVIQASA